ncbi:hypothetical protein [Hymenobacter glacieicola]|uniref:Peptidase C51 domain-containing protein n=1 Tax=Hymenobacter glacieicola TaxID=1562124 RepID=A0ABQ1WMJ0_9BACT|nr:hypothetical protein [Hymenobacter glacieicola]GGG34313.1 hypothetical protein GCM10011378_08410 [Hymenobacter glacieicola]
MKHLLVLYLLLVTGSLQVAAQVAHRAKPGAVACQLQVATARLYVREATGRNDGPEVWAAQKAAGAKKGDPWCGCEMFVQQQACGLPSPKWPAAARNWSQSTDPRTFFIRGLRGSLDSLRPGHIVTFYYANLGRVGHVGKVVALGRAVRAGRAPRTYLVNSGNTGRGGGRDGAGVYNVNYPAYQVYAGANWSY